MFDTPTLATQLLSIDPSRFANLCNELLVQNAIRLRIPRDHLALNLLITDPDGGIDARCLDAPVHGGRLCPRKNCVYQFKSGHAHKTAGRLAKEDVVNKPRVKEALAAGRAVVFLIAHDHGDQFEESVAAETRQLGFDVQPGQIVVISGAILATLIQPFPALASRIMNLDIAALRFEDWAGQARLRNPYQTDQGVSDRLEDLRTRLRAAKSRVRLVGLPGDGKTRTLLEAIRGTDLQAITFYASQPDEIPNPLLEYLRHTSDARCLLVVDEVDDEQAERLLAKCETLPDGISLALIGLDASGRPQPETLQVEGLNEELMVKIILSIAQGIPNEMARDIARSCERSPKLAVIVADRVRANPSLASQPLTDRTIQSALERYLQIPDADLNAISGAALLMRLGWNGNAEKESEVLYNAIGVDPIDSRRRVEMLHERYGIAPVGGRFRYISPAILGDHWAAIHLKGWTGDKFKNFLSQLSPEMAKSFTLRIRRLSAVISNREAVEKAVFSDRGPFRSLEELDRTEFAHLLKNLAGVFPHAVLHTLERLISAASIAELKAADQSRRELVWTLEELLWREDTFEKAAGILLRLAIAENETWGNSATGIWAETFQTLLGRTAAGLVPRLRVLRMAARNEDSEARRLAAIALESSLKTGHITRGGYPPSDVPDMPKQEWRPETYSDWADAIIQYLSLVQDLLIDQSYVVRMATVHALAEATEAAIGFPKVLPKWLETARLLVGSDFDLRSKILRTIELEIDRYQTKRNERDSVTEEEPGDEDKKAQMEVTEHIKQLQEFMGTLLGASFSSRLRWRGIRDPWRLHIKDDDEVAKQRKMELENLAREALITPALLGQEWKWLLARTDAFPEELAEIFGKVDTERKLASTIKRLAESESRAMTWFSLYEIGNAQLAEDPQRIDARLKELLQEGAKPEQIFDLLWRAGPSPFRLELLLTLFTSKALSGSHIDNLLWSPWRRIFSPEHVVILLRAVADDPNASDSTISFLSIYLHSKPEALQVLRDIAIEFLQRERSDKIRERRDHDWDELAERLVEIAPYDVAKSVLRELASRESSLESDLAKVIRIAWTISDKSKMFREVIAPWLDVSTSDAWWIRQAIKQFPLEETGIEELLRWVSENPEVRVPTVADIIGPPTSRVSDLHAMLLERFSEQNPGGIFYGSFVSGAWSGPASKRTQGKIEDAKTWVNDERPVVREWSSSVLRALEETLKRDLKSEEEERFR